MSPWLRVTVLGLAGLFLLGPGEPLTRAAPLANLPHLPEPADHTASPLPGSPVAQREDLLRRLGVDAWHRAGFRGQGVKVAILDSGFRDYRSFLGKALPSRVTVRSFRADGDLEARDSQHGILCGEVVHALAPEAEILLANWDPDKPATFLAAAQWAREQGARVLSCSLIMPSWSDGEGGGLVNAALARLLTAGPDALFFASAGNIAQRHWSGAFQGDASGYHQWTANHRNNAITPWGNERISVELYGPACAGLELQVFEAGAGKRIGTCAASAEGSASGCPFAAVRFWPQTGTRYYVRIRSPRGTANRVPFHLVVLGANLNYTTASGSIPCPADGEAVCAVGAVDSDGDRMNYSSCGPNSRQPKPDFVAEVPFPSLWRERPFAGTSAAAPQAAALAALVWSRHPKWSAAEVNAQLRRASRDLGPMGHDEQTGHGMVRLP